MQAVSRVALVVIVAVTHNNLKIEETITMKRLMSVTITLLFVFTLVFLAQVAGTQAQMHMDDDYMADAPWDDDQINDYPCDDDYMADSPWDDDHMAGFPWGDGPMTGFPGIDEDYMMGFPQYYTPVMFWTYFWMLYMMVFMGPGV